jgi:hypothetical protein
MKYNRLALAAAWIGVSALASAAELRLKTRTIEPGAGGKQAAVLEAGAIARSVSGQRYRWLVQREEEAPGWSEWKQRGVKVLAAVPVNGYIVSAPAGFDPEGLSYSYLAPIAASDKVSPELQGSEMVAAAVAEEPERKLVLVHFHGDVEGWEADGILATEGLTAIENASLEPQDRLVEVTGAQMQTLALWDEVEYIFPAPEGMKNGEIYLACGGVLSGELEVAMLAASYGEGWDGPGRGRAELTFSLGSLGTRTEPGATRAEVVRALAEWSRVVAVSFRETTNRTAARNLDILFATGEHGDPFPFQAGSSVLGHSFFPAPPNPEPLAGDIHVNDAWSWSIGGQWDIYSLMLHEIGHSLGIGHTDRPESVMYPYYRKAEKLTEVDIASIRQLYAAPEEEAAPLGVTITAPTVLTTSATAVNVGGTLTGAGPGVAVTRLNLANGEQASCLVNSVQTTFSCANVPLVTGNNTIRVTATLAGRTANTERTVARTAPAAVSLTVNAVAAATTAAAVSLSGTASHPDGMASVTWRNQAGQSGTATGLENWTASVPLQAGLNNITIRGTARNGAVAERTVSVTRNTPTTTTPTEDRVPPRMTIQQPIGNFILTSAPRLTFRGVATDNVGVTKVTWTNTAGNQSGAATANTVNGVVNWSFDVSLAVGFNTIQVRAWDSAGNSTLYSTTVRRY